MDPTLDRWLDAIKVAATTAVIALLMALGGDGSAGATVVVVGALGAWLMSPLSPIGSGTSHEQALTEAAEDDVVVYWRPGCSVCLVLLARLDRSQRAAIRWVNVVREHDAAMFVRSLRGDDMVTPTAITGRGDLIPASTTELAAHTGGD